MSDLYASTHADAERSIVHSCLLDPAKLTDVDLEPHHFAGHLWRDCWRVMREFEQAGQPIDPLLVADQLREEGNSNISAGDLLGDASSISVVEALAIRLREAHIARSVAFACSEVLGSIKTGQRGSDALDDAMAMLSAVDTGQASGALTTKEIALARFAELEQIAAAKARGEDALTGISTGLRQLDELLGGLQRGICTVVGARPGMGKSAFAMSLCRGAEAQDVGAHVFSLEDVREAYADRLLSGATGVHAEKLRRCDLTAGDLDLISRRGGRVTRSRGWLVDDRSGITAEEIVRSVRRARRDNGTELVVVDYLQLVKASSDGKRNERLGHSMQVFADAAKQDRMAYVILSQLNRELERRDDKRPMQSDLKESGDIEDKAKCILFLYRGEVYGDNKHQGMVEILIAKNNNGKTGAVLAGWDPDTIRIF